jgi:hypothetical protein
MARLGRRLFAIICLVAYLYFWLQFRYLRLLAPTSTASVWLEPSRLSPGLDDSRVNVLLEAERLSAERLFDLIGMRNDCVAARPFETLPSLRLPWQRQRLDGVRAVNVNVDDAVDEPEEESPRATDDSVTPPANRLIFAIHPGASGAGYLAQLLGTASERNRALHIPAALAMGGDEIMRLAMNPLSESLLLRMVKADRIEQAFSNFLLPNGVYIETNPNFISTFFDVVVERFVRRGWRVDIVVLHRHFGRTLKSLIERGYYSLNAATSAELLSPFAADRALQPLARADEMDEYDSLIAFMLDVYARGARLARQLESMPNVRFVPLRFESLLSLRGAKAAFRALDLTWNSRSEQFVIDSPIVDAGAGVVARFRIDTTLEYCEQRIDRFLTRCGAACPSVQFARHDVLLHGAQTLAPFLDALTSNERAADDLRTGATVLHFSDAALQAAFEAWRQLPMLPSFSQLPRRSAARATALVVCVQFCFVGNSALAQVQRVRATAMCDKMIAFAVGAADRVVPDDLALAVDAVARNAELRMNRERDFNAAVHVARFLNATHLIVLARDALLSPDCATSGDVHRRSLAALLPGEAAQLSEGRVLAVALGDDQFVGVRERVSPLNFADAPVSMRARAFDAAQSCRVLSLENEQKHAQLQRTWLDLFSAVFRVELADSAMRELLPTKSDAARFTSLPHDALMLSLRRDYELLEGELLLRATLARRWLDEIRTHSTLFNVSLPQVADWSRVFR